MAIAKETTAKAGHNRSGGVDNTQLQSIVNRIEKLEEDKQGIADDIKEVFAEAKSNGFDIKIIKKLIALRKKDQAERDEEELLLETYMIALGMLATTPLGEAALKRASEAA